MNLADLPTPCLVLDRTILTRNLSVMAAALARLNVPLRPHMKTAKSIDVARLATRRPARRHHRLHPGGGGVFPRPRHHRHPVCGRHHAAEARRRCAKLNAAGAQIIVITDDPAMAGTIAGQPVAAAHPDRNRQRRGTRRRASRTATCCLNSPRAWAPAWPAS